MVRSTVERLAYACSSLEGLSVGDSLGGDVDANHRHLLIARAREINFPPEDLAEIERAIEEDCERIDWITAKT